jgi:hypothetical protein
MPTRSPEILALAGRIRDANNDECGHRSAASRAYYAALLQSREKFGLAARKPTGEPDSSHDRIIRAAALAEPAYPGAASVATTLVKMRDSRNKADYDIGVDYVYAEMRDMFIYANRVMSLIAGLAANPVPAPATTPTPPPSPRPGLKRVK